MSSHIIDRQTFIISVNLFDFAPGPPEVPSQVQLPMNLRFAADELVLKSITYSPDPAQADIKNMIQIWCNLTNDNLLAAFPNTTASTHYHNDHFRISNTFQTGNFVLQFQETATANPASYLPQPLISSVVQTTFGTVALTIEFLKLAK